MRILSLEPGRSVVQVNSMAVFIGARKAKARWEA